jgi:hypothetical protein
LLQAQTIFCVSLSFISIFPWYIAVKFTTLSEKVKKKDERHRKQQKGIHGARKIYFSSKINQFK